jgi:hypothetical protein
MVQQPMSPLGDLRVRPPRLEVLRWTNGLRPEKGLPARKRGHDCPTMKLQSAPVVAFCEDQHRLSACKSTA